MNRGMVLLLNKAQAGRLAERRGRRDAGHRTRATPGNGTRKVLPAPPGEPYVSAGCDYFIAGDFDLDYVRSVSAGYGNLTQRRTEREGRAGHHRRRERMALSDYMFIRIAAPAAADPDAGALGLPTQSLAYAGTRPRAHGAGPGRARGDRGVVRRSGVAGPDRRQRRRRTAAGA